MALLTPLVFWTTGFDRTIFWVVCMPDLAFYVMELVFRARRWNRRGRVVFGGRGYGMGEGGQWGG
jgi:hypothetical protein